jgi:hypothetical protein
VRLGRDLSTKQGRRSPDSRTTVRTTSDEISLRFCGVSTFAASMCGVYCAGVHGNVKEKLCFQEHGQDWQFRLQCPGTLAASRIGKKAAPDGESRANRSGPRTTRFARLPPAGANQKDRKVMKDIWTPSKTRPQNGISSSVIGPPPPVASAPGAGVGGRLAAPPSPGGPPRRTMSRARTSVVLRLLPS